MGFEKMAQENVDELPDLELSDALARENDKDSKEMFVSYETNSVIAEEVDKKNFLEAEQFLEHMKKAGVVIDDDSHSRLLEILSSHEILHVDRNEMASLIKYDKSDPGLAHKLIKLVDEEFYSLMESHLAQESQEIFSGKNINVVQMQSVRVDGVDISFGELSDKEIVQLGNENITHIVHDIISDEIEVVGQGMFWNVLIPKNNDSEMNFYHIRC